MAFFVIPDPFDAFSGQTRGAQYHSVYPSKCLCNCYFPIDCERRINSHDHEERKKELAYMGPGSANPLVETEQLTNAHLRPSGGEGLLLPYSFSLFWLGLVFDSLIFPIDHISYLKKQSVLPSFFYLVTSFFFKTFIYTKVVRVRKPSLGPRIKNLL